MVVGARQFSIFSNKFSNKYFQTKPGLSKTIEFILIFLWDFALLQNYYQIIIKLVHIK